MGTNIKGWDLQMMGNLYFELKLMNLDSWTWSTSRCERQRCYRVNYDTHWRYIIYEWPLKSKGVTVMTLHFWHRKLSDLNSWGQVLLYSLKRRLHWGSEIRSFKIKKHLKFWLFEDQILNVFGPVFLGQKNLDQDLPNSYWMWWGGILNDAPTMRRYPDVQITC